MNAQTLTKPATIFDLFVLLPDEDFATKQPICASSLDYGFDFDEEEVARELLAPLPASLLSQENTEVDADEFESRHLWFLS
jgi:hypothetical protein